MESVGSGFNTIQTVYLRLTDAESNVHTVTQKTQEQLDSEENVVIIDARGQEISDCPGTQGYKRAYKNITAYSYAIAANE